MGIGWDVDFQLTDWLVPGGVWAHQGSYIAALQDIAQAVGGYVQPHNTDPVLRILHKYPTAPWDWGTVTPDFEIPSALAEVESTEFIDKPIGCPVRAGIGPRPTCWPRSMAWLPRASGDRPLGEATVAASTLVAPCERG